MVNEAVYKNLIEELKPKQVTLVAVSKTKSIEEIKQLYDLGQRDFGENYVQELVEKEKSLPKDIRWHFIGHLQTNKVKQIAPFIHLIQSVDSLKLLKEINKQAEKINRVIDCLLQIYIAQEETKFGLDEREFMEIIKESLALDHARIIGVMGMASLTDDMNKVRNEFKNLKIVFDTFHSHNPNISTLSMGMTSDYKTAIKEGSNMVRVGSLIFGERNT